LRTRTRDFNQQRGTKREPKITRKQDILAAETIGRMSGNQEKKNIRQELSQPDVTEVKRAPRDLVNLPAHGDRLHFDRRNNTKAFEFVQREINVAECGQAGMMLSRGHVVLMCHNPARHGTAVVRLE
jgi:hypothetical protein